MLFVPSIRTWFLQNTETSQILKGAFEPLSTSRNIQNNWAEHNALSRTKSILQFLNGQAQTISVDIRLYAETVVGNSIERDLTLMESWTLPQSSLKNRPPVLTFWIGDAHLLMDCVIMSMSNIRYGAPNLLGAVRDVSLTLELKEYTNFSLEDNELYETRYHRARVRDYYEMLTQKEYGNPLMGDIIRKRHPSLPVVNTGDTVKLPSVEAIRKDIVEPKSIALQTAFGKKDTPQKRLRAEMFDKRNRPYVSHIVIE
jgi:hypothetical protein